MVFDNLLESEFRVGKGETDIISIICILDFYCPFFFYYNGIDVRILILPRFAFTTVLQMLPKYHVCILNIVMHKF